MSFIGTSLAFALLTAATESAPESRAKELDEVARVATVMVDGDVCQRRKHSRQAHQLGIRDGEW